MNCDTGNGIVDLIVVVFFLLLCCGFGWWIPGSEVRTLQREANRLRNVEELCRRLWLQLQERSEQRYTHRQRRLAPALRKSASVVVASNSLVRVSPIRRDGPVSGG